MSDYRVPFETSFLHALQRWKIQEASVSYDTINGIQQFSICITGAHGGVSGLPHDIQLLPLPLVLLGSPQVIFPAHYLKIFCQLALRDLQNPALSSQDMPESPPTSMCMLYTASIRMRLTNGGLTMVCPAARLQHHHAPCTLAGTQGHASGWLLAASRLPAHPLLGVGSATKIY